MSKLTLFYSAKFLSIFSSNDITEFFYIYGFDKKWRNDISSPGYDINSFFFTALVGYNLIDLVIPFMFTFFFQGISVT